MKKQLITILLLAAVLSSANICAGCASQKAPAETTAQALTDENESAAEASVEVPEEKTVYAEAFALIDEGKPDEAKALVSSLEATKEKADWIMKLENYKKALVHMENGELEDAARLIKGTGWEGKPAEYLELCEKYVALRYWDGVSGVDHKNGESELSAEELGEYRIRFKIHDDSVEALYSEADLESFIDTSAGVRPVLLEDGDDEIIYREMEGFHSYLNLNTGEYILLNDSETTTVIEALFDLKAK